VTDLPAALDVHVADSLSALGVPEVAAARRIADVGAGAGFPGLVLAAALPGTKVDLVDSASRKTAIVDRLIRAAELGNARSVTARAEEWGRVPGALGGGREEYDLVTARAVGPLAVLCEYAAPLLREQGLLVAWKGARSADEEAGAAAAAAALGLEVGPAVSVRPYEGSRERHLYVVRKSGPTPSTIPRRPGMARKRPLG
jgi:16S rRNA (guanine527-N7)-methyltransferase